MKFIFRFILFLFVLNAYPVFSQDQMLRQKKERKKLWRHWKRNRQSYNPYLDKKAKNKPSAKMARAEKKEIKRQNRRAKRQMRHSKRKIRK